MSKSDKKLRILMFPSDTFGCGYYRMLLPGKKLQERGHTVDFRFNFDDIPTNYHIYHFQRVTTPAGLESIKRLQAAGKIVMMDMDDDLFHLYPGHPSSWYFRKGKECRNCHNVALSQHAIKCDRCGSRDLEYQDRLKCCADAFPYIDVLTVSTPELQERYGKVVKRSVIIQNCLDIGLYDSVPKKDDKYVAVGWAGSFTHTLDLTALTNGLDVLNKYDNAYFFTAGESDENTKRIFKSVFSDPEKMIAIPPVDIDTYPDLLHNFDIGLAPISDNAFNRAKSELKAIEYGAVGIPVIASDVGPYRRYIEDGVNGFLVSKPREWRKYIELLVKDEGLRKKMGKANYDKACTMDINKRITEREDLYTELYEEKGISFKAGGGLLGGIFG